MEETSAYGKLIAKLTVPAATLIAVLLALMLACLLFVARYQSDVAWQEQAKLAAGAILVHSDHVKRRAMDYGAWDDAVEHLVTHPDPDWADENVGKTIFLNLDMEMTVVVAPDGTVTYASVDGERTQARLDDLLSGGIAELMARQRSGPRNDAVSGLVLAKGQPAVAAVMPIRPLEPDPNATEPQHLIILVDLIDGAMLKQFAEIYLLPGLHILGNGEDASHAVPIVLSDGRTVGALGWRGADPGAELLRLSIPVWIVVAVSFAGLTAILFRKAMRVAARFDDNEYRARHDALTDLPNRFFLFQAIEQLAGEATTARGFAVAYMDLDGFKPINDQLGHAAGDLVLRTIAERTRAGLPQSSLVARNGGDEFVALLRDVSTPGAARMLCAMIAERVREPIDIDGRPVTVGITIGVAFCPTDGTDALTLMRKADEALYDGKKQGGDRIGFFDARRAEAAIEHRAAARA